MPRTHKELLGGTNQFLKENFVRKPQCENRKRRYSQTDIWDGYKTPTPKYLDFT
jgi:hypothetical protein